MSGPRPSVRERARALLAPGWRVFAGVVLLAFATVFVIARRTPTVEELNGLTVTYPQRWQLTKADLTPGLTDPRQVLALGTTALEPGGTRCTHLPENAINGIADDDAMIWIAERWSVGAADGPRLTRFPPPSQIRNADDSQDCVPDRRFTSWFFSLREAGRGFHVLVVFGADASANTESEAWRILTNLKMKPRE